MKQFINNLSIGRKLYGGFGVVVGLLALVAIVSFWGMGQLDGHENTITQTVNPKVGAASDVKYAAADLNGWQTAYVLDHGKSRSAFLTSNAYFAKALAKLDKLSTDAGDKQTLKPLQDGYAKFMKLDVPTYGAIKRGNFAEANRIALGPEIAAYNELAKGADEYVKQAQAEQDKADKSFSSAASSTKSIMIVLTLIAIAIAGFVAYVIASGIKRIVAAVLERSKSLVDNDVTDLATALDAMAEGDLTQTVTPVTEPIEVTSHDEIGQVADAVNGIRDRVRASVDSYNAMAAKLSGLIGEVSGTAGTVSSASQQMASTSEEAGKAVGEIATAVGDVAQGAERQVRQVESVKGSADEAALAAQTSADQAREAAEVAEQARVVAEEGVGAAEQATQAMRAERDSYESVRSAIRDLAGKSEEIGAIVETITGIAGQTNLLALNAA